MLFDLGQLVMTRGVAIRQEEEPYFGRHVMAALLRYMDGDWGEMDYENKKMNDMAIGPNPERIFAAYACGRGSDGGGSKIVRQGSHGITTLAE